MAFGLPALGLVSKLNGRKILVKGNHDYNAQRMGQAGFAEVHNSLDLVTSYGLIRMAHEPPGFNQPEDSRPNYYFCGHVHDSFARKQWLGYPPIINVGVDVRDHEPKTITELLAAK